MEKKYVIITDSIRERMTSQPIPINVGKDIYNYRKGDLGLLHPKIMDFYSDFDKNLERCATERDNKGKIIYTKGLISIPTSGLMLEVYMHNKNNIPILMYDGNLRKLPGDEKGYFMTSLRKGEYNVIDGIDLDSVKKGIKEIYKKRNISLRCSIGNLSQEETLEKTIDEQWRNLEAFDILMENKIHEIPIEVAQMKISKNSIRNRREFLKEIGKYGGLLTHRPVPIIK